MGMLLSKRSFSLLSAAAISIVLAGQIFALNAGHVATTEVDPKTGEFTVSFSTDNGNIWSKPIAVSKNGSLVKAYSVSTAEGLPSIVWIESSGGLSKIFFTKASIGHPVSEIISLPKIDAIDMVSITPSSPFIIFSGEHLLYVTNSVDGGKNWSRAKTFSMEHPAKSLECSPDAGGISVVTDLGSIEPVIIPSPAAPGFLIGGDIFTFSRDIVQAFAPSPGTEKNAVAYFLEVSPDKEFLSPISSTIEGETIKFSLPTDFIYGTYYCRIAAWNGLKKTYSDTKILHFTADNIAPEIKMIKPSGSDWIRNGAIAAFEFSCTDPQDDIKDEAEAAAYLNGSTLEASLVYDKGSSSITGIASIPENAPDGTNTLRVKIKDVWGNCGSMEAGIAVDSKPPVLGITLKNNTAYSNNRDKVQVHLKDDGAGPDLHNSSIKLFYQGVTVEGTQTFDVLSGSLIFIPAAGLQKDNYSAEITARDLAGNRGEKIVFAVAIDQTVPKISLDPVTFETTAGSISISGTIDKINLASISVKNNSSPAKAIRLSKGHFSAGIELDRGENNLTVTAVDLAGNSSTATSKVYFLAPPDTAFFKFDDKTISDGDFVSSTASVKITDDTGSGISGGIVKIDGAEVPYNTTTGMVSAGPFAAGTFAISLMAGTKTYSLSFSVQDAMKINSAIPCPNPFNPVSQTASITYNVSKDSDVSAYIFDTRGSIVWKGNAAAKTGFNNNLTWDGKSLDGRLLSNGVYIVRLYAKDPVGNISACSGKIVVLK
ncbi:MAG: hypothetical protein WC527_07080 [Candidatus Margulisiibacteriota bacterium]